ncbi:Udp-glycosyltransferase 85a4, partial [Thalictrum thalictroides]
MESTSLPKKPHAVCIPMPFQSHINAMLKLAKLLYFKGFHITFVNTEFNHRKVLNSRGPDSLNGLPDFRFETIPDGLPPCDINATQELVPLCMAAKNNFLDPFRKLIDRLNKESGDSGTSRVTCIVADAILAFPLDIAKELGIPGVVLWTMSAAFLMMVLHCQHLIENGVIPLK